MPEVAFTLDNGDVVIYTAPGANPPTGELPEPIPDPVGWFVYPGDGNRPARVRHDDVFWRPRKITNETFPLREYDPVAHRVSPVSKVIVRLDRDIRWIWWLRDLMGERVLGHFAQPGYGFMDTNAEDTDPYTDEMKLGVITCGGNLVNVNDVVQVSSGRWGLVDYQNVNADPDRSLTRENAPHLFIKQVLVGNTVEYPIFWVVDKGEIGGMGDVVWPFLSDRPVALRLNELEFFPEPPFDAYLCDVPVQVDAYCFSGSNVMGQVNGAWYMLEEMLVTGDVNDKGLGGNWLDRRLYIEHPDWPDGCAPPVIGWTREKPVSFLAKVLADLGIIPFLVP